MIDYIHFCLAFRNVLPNKLNTDSYIENKISVEEILQSSEVSDDLKAYYNTEIQTSLPSQLDQDKILVFDSNFECGNLDRVSIVSLNEYNLFLKPDTNTKGHSQWFYFSVTNTMKDKKVTFNILNCTKQIELFKHGMRPLIFSEHNYRHKNTQWTSNTTDIKYYKNDIIKSNTSFYYTLSFSFTFPYSNDRVYFAFNRPYTLTMNANLLKSIINSLEKDLDQLSEVKEDYYWMEDADFKVNSKNIYYGQETLCKSYCGIPITLLTITNTEYSYQIIIRYKQI